ATTQRPDCDIHHLSDARRRHWFPDEPQGLRRGLRQAAVGPPARCFFRQARFSGVATSQLRARTTIFGEMRIPIMNSRTTSLLERAGLDRKAARRQLARGLEGADDGELYLEYAQSEMLVFDNGRLKQATYNTDQGFGLRAVKDEAVGYAHSSDVSEAA